MLRRHFKLRVFCTLLCFSLVASIIVFTTVNLVSVGFAASTLNTNLSTIKFSYDGGTWSYDSSSGNVTGKATGSAKTNCDDAKSASSTMTVKNSSSSDRYILSMNYGSITTGSSGSVVLNGQNLTSSSSGIFKKELAPNESFTITLNSGNAGAYTAQIVLSSLTETKLVTKTCTFLVADNGTYTVDGTTITAATSYTKTTAEDYSVVATASSGYKFVCWLIKLTDSSDDFTIFSYSSSINPLTISDNCYFKPYFILSSSPAYRVGSYVFDDFEDAFSTATEKSIKDVVLISSGTLSGTHTIPSGKDFYVPFNIDNTKGTVSGNEEHPNVIRSGSSGQGAFVILTLPADGKIIVSSNSRLVVASSASNSQKTNGCIHGKYGQIKMTSGSEIELLSGSRLVCWGIVSGYGNVYARDGSAVYELFQITSFRGGTATSSMNNNSRKVFPFNSYYVQNIEANLYIYYGATEYVYSALGVSGSLQEIFIPFIAKSSGMFHIYDKSGYVVKRANEEVNGISDDRIYIDVYGKVDLSSFSVEVYVSLNTASYILPLGSNYTVSVHRNALVKTNQSLSLLPGCQLKVYSGGRFVVNSGKYLYVYAQSDWGNYVYDGAAVIPCPYTSYGVGKETNTKRIYRQYSTTEGEGQLLDAEIDIMGEIKVEGYLLETQGGANIHSSSTTGVLKLAPNSDLSADGKKTYQANMSGSSISYTTIATDYPTLKNGANISSPTTVSTSLGQFYEYASPTDSPDDGQWNGETYSGSEYVMYFEFNGTDNFYVSIVEGKSYTFLDKDDPLLASYLASIDYEMYGWVNSTKTLLIPGGESRLITSAYDEEIFEPFFGGWVGNKYYSYYGKTVNGLFKIESCAESENVASGGMVYPNDVCLFNDGTMIRSGIEDGETVPSLNWAFYYDSNTYSECGDNNYYFLIKGVVDSTEGWKVSDANNEYYVGPNGYAYSNGYYYIGESPSHPAGVYYFNAKAILSSSSAPVTILEDIALDADNKVCYGYGLFSLTESSKTYLYYALDDGSIFKNGTMYVEKTNGYKINGVAIKEGLYYFDSNGRMYDSSFVLVDSGVTK